MAKKFVYTITTGRSGTNYLADLFKANIEDARIYHERANFVELGRRSPDASHFTHFNTFGNTRDISAFWKQKLSDDGAERGSTYIETSHLLAKAGLFENIGFLPNDSEIHVIVLRRPVDEVLWSLYNRFDFANLGFTWLWYLDPRYRNKIVSYEPFKPHGPVGAALWYIIEMQVRAKYYRLLHADTPNIQFHDAKLKDLANPEGASRLLGAIFPTFNAAVEIPEKSNATQRWHFDEAERQGIKEIVVRTQVDVPAIAQSFFNAGRRLATPDWRKKAKAGGRDG